MAITAPIRQHFATMQPGDRRALAICTVFLAVVVGYVYVLEPLLFRYDQARRTLTELSDQQRRFSRQVALLPRREAKMAENRARLTALRRHFDLDPVSPEVAVSRSITELTYYARLADVEIGSLRPLEALSSGSYQLIPVEVESSGEYAALQKFFYYIDTSSSLLAITDLDLGVEAPDRVQARLKLVNIIRPQATGAAPTPMPEDHRLQLVVSRWTGNAPLVVAKQQGFLDTDALRVELLPVDDKVTAERLLLSGAADGVSTNLPELLNFWIKGMPLRIVLPLDRTAGTEGVVVRDDSPVRTLADLRQRTVAVDQQGILNFVLVRALAGAGLALSDVRTRSLEPGQVARDIVNGTLEVGLTREPFLSTLVNSGQARVIYASDDLRGLIADFLAIAPGAAKNKEAAVRGLVEGVLEAQRFIVEQPEQALEIVAKWEGQLPGVTRANLAKITLFDPAASRRFFDQDELAGMLAVFEDYFRSLDQPFPLVTHEDLADASFIRRAKAPSATAADADGG